MNRTVHSASTIPTPRALFGATIRPEVLSDADASLTSTSLSSFRAHLRVEDALLATLSFERAADDPATARKIRHAVTVVADMDPDRLRTLRQRIDSYLYGLDRGWSRYDAFRLWPIWARMLGLSFSSTSSPAVEIVAREVLAVLDAEVDRLTADATATGQPAAVAMLHLIGGAR